MPCGLGDRRPLRESGYRWSRPTTVQLNRSRFGRLDYANVELAQLLRPNLRRGAHHQILRLLSHREDNDFADIWFIGEQHDDAIDARSRTAVRRRAELEGVDHARKLGVDFLLGIARNRERLVHDIRAVVPDRARRQLHAVADDVVLEGEDIERILALQRLQPALRHRERIVREVDLLVVLVILEHWEVDDPAELEALLIDQAELFAHAGAGEAGELGRLRFLASREEQPVIRPEAERVGHRVHALFAMVLGDRAAPLAALAGGVAEAGEALGLRPGVHVVEELAALLGGARRGDRTDHVAALDDRGEAAEARALEELRHVRDQDRVAQVRLVVAVLQHRFAVRNAAERQRGDAATLAVEIRELLEDAVQHRLDRGEHVILRDVAHLEVELVELARRTVSAGILVTKAGRDLEIAIEARHHQQLLEHLRRLRKRVELAWVHAARNEIVARAFRRRGRQDRRLELGEALIDHAAAD